MGLALPALRLIAREHQKKPLKGPILTIGRQCVYATVSDIQKMLHEEGLKPHILPKGCNIATNIPAWKNTPLKKYTSDRVFFMLLTGHPSFALDISRYEDAEYAWDLNHKIPSYLEHVFGTVIDSGSLEHVFNVSEALINMNRLTAPDGKIIHLTPANNYLEHGFYQFSPTLFTDYYGVNNFANISCKLIEQPLLDGNRNWTTWKWNFKRPYTNIITNRMNVIFVSAQKQESSTEDVIPQQGEYSHHGEGGRTGEFQLSSWQKTIIESSPIWLISFIKRILCKDLKIKPWGLKYTGKV
ncbi:MAG TPA: hypothetical protein VLG69_01250 [Candidatus Andersenbacteria bacterium]|nr:hypothetical protein [Candidatus Andersenbacteria bacterium]